MFKWFKHSLEQCLTYWRCYVLIEPCLAVNSPQIDKSGSPWYKPLVNLIQVEGETSGVISLSSEDPSHPLSSFQSTVWQPLNFNLLCSAWNPLPVSLRDLAKLFFYSLSPHDTGRHICCSYIYLELGIERRHTWTRICVHSHVELWACEHTCVYARTCACMDPHGCPFTHFHGHMSPWMTYAWKGMLGSIYTHALVSRQGCPRPCACLVWCSRIYSTCIWVVCMFAHVCFCGYSVWLWCELASPCAQRHQGKQPARNKE